MSETEAVNVERLVSVKEACRYGRFSHTTLYRLINAGKINAYKEGSRTKVDLDSVDAYKRSLPRIMPRAVA